MGMAGIGAIMLVVVLVVYLRMVDKRMKHRQRSNRADQLVVEQADTLVEFGRSQDAIKLLEQALRERPRSGPIRARLEWLRIESEN